jgi:hypothetical protein
MMQFKNVKLDINSGENIKFFEPQHYKNILDIDLDKLVKNVIANEEGKRIISLPTETIPEIHSSIKQTTDYKDDNRGLKDTFTDFVNDVILNNENSLFNFLYIITSLFQDAISIYKRSKDLKENDIFFILKGGNVLRFVAKNFLFNISGGTTDILLNFYKNFFKRSDADFSIVINPALQDYENIFNDMSLLTYNLLKHIQSIFELNKTRFFEWYKYDNEGKKALIHDLFNNIQELDFSKNDTWKTRTITSVAFENISYDDESIYKNPQDIAVRFKERYNLKTDTVLWPIDNTNEEIYVSYNEALSFMKDRLIKFNLIRAKYGFTVHYHDTIKNTPEIISIGGELIDVSIGHRDDEFVNKFYDTVKKNISLFELKISDRKIFKFRSYSILYLFKDLYRILFIDVDYPWKDSKYVKRLNRLFYIGYIDLFVKFPDNKKRLDYLNLLLEIILSIEKLLSDETNNKDNNGSVYIRKQISQLKNKVEQSEIILDMFLDQTLNLLLYKNTESTDSSSSSSKIYTDTRDDYAPYNVDKSSSLTYTSPSSSSISKHIESTSSVSNVTSSYISSSSKTLYEYKMDYIEACKDNLEILLISFKNIDVYCHHNVTDEKSIYENILYENNIK